MGRVESRLSTFPALLEITAGLPHFHCLGDEIRYFEATAVTNVAAVPAQTETIEAIAEGRFDDFLQRYRDNFLKPRA